MTKIGIFKQVYGEYTFLYDKAESIKEAEDIAITAYMNRVQTNCHYFIRTVSNNSNIGDLI